MHDDDVGAVARLTPEDAVAAARLVRRGALFNLDYPINAFTPPVSPSRQPAAHTIFGTGPNNRDDYLDSFYLQASSHIDGLRHMKSPTHGWYGGAGDESIAVGSPVLGVNRWAERGIVGRGVLIDVERHLGRHGRRLDQRAGEPISAAVLDATLSDQGTAVRAHDLLLIRTGWAEHYFNEMSDHERSALPNHWASPGIEQNQEMVSWISQHDCVMIAADNLALECLPPSGRSPFGTPARQSAGSRPMVAWMIHDILIAEMGLVIGELWNLERLAEDCASDGVYEMMLSCKPLNLIGGVGSPANALALK